MSDADKLREAFEQLTRYSGGVEDDRIIQVIQCLVDINDDLAHARDPAEIEATKQRAIALISEIESHIIS
jgi:hypothetical protein